MSTLFMEDVNLIFGDGAGGSHIEGGETFLFRPGMVYFAYDCHNEFSEGSRNMITIIDYKAGNAPSVLHAVTHLGYESRFARSPQDLADATHIILPGVGSAKATMDSLREMNLIETLEDAVLRKKVFFIGICVGLQILFEHSAEDDTDCLGWLKGRVVKFDVSKVRVPQMGWNQVRFVKNAPCGGKEGYFYFVNSYHAKPENESDLWGVADYNGKFTAAVQRENIFATQFHIEKSGEAGLALFNGFLSLKQGADLC
ncbi:MAG: imidazole glycerol phosphate synthase subunit HisH [Treponema sp.]|jgi:glutamine amidotransferase|nr:imidazole glycerol phosphate synthase subunit HisH [Treponema sp.]